MGANFTSFLHRIPFTPHDVVSPSSTTPMANTRPGDGLTVAQLLDALQGRLASIMFVTPSYTVPIWRLTFHQREQTR